MSSNSTPILNDGSRVAVIGGGPAGAFFGYFMRQLAQRIDVDIQVDIYERRDFTALGPTGCNMCAGVISESLIQSLSVEGINLPSTVVQRGINSFVLHTEQEDVTMYAPFHEMRIATVYRGGGPKDGQNLEWESFDNYIMNLAASKEVKVIRDRITDLSWNGDKPQVHLKDKAPETYDLIVGAFGVNSPSAALFEKLGIGYQRPKVRKTFTIELGVGSEFVTRKLGSSMHAFLLNLPHLDFAALIPKGNYVTMCLIGERVDSKFVDSFMQHQAVRGYLAGNESHNSGSCSCSPNASLGYAVKPFGHRVVIIGDSGMSRLNKDGIGSAYRTAKAAAVTCLFRGVSDEDFRASFWPICQTINRDNFFGRLIYKIVDLIKRVRFLTRGVMRMTKGEQMKPGRQRRMSMVLWDMFTGSAPYGEVFRRCLHPYFIGGFLWNIMLNLKKLSGKAEQREDVMEKGGLGKVFRDGEVIVNQGDTGDCMYIIQAGRAEVLQKKEDKEVRLAMLEEGDVFGEMALFQQQPRSATVRASGEARVLTVDKRIFLRRVHEDPSFAYLILQKMSQRIRDLDAELVQMKT
ncbi:MAG TPA: cyclic nucleotide-binding domain-containing protein [Dehalococcoidia bacterium]|nr:cyclic nucleotide-binding domain-containing protein [Dehalococcoidia bacterium]